MSLAIFENGRRRLFSTTPTPWGRSPKSSIITTKTKLEELPACAEMSKRNLQLFQEVKHNMSCVICHNICQRKAPFIHRRFINIILLIIHINTHFFYTWILIRLAMLLLTMYFFIVICIFNIFKTSSDFV